MEKIILELSNVSRTVDNKQIVNTLSFQFQKNRIYAIIGPSGAGKSSLLRLLNRLDEPTSGEIMFAGKKQSDYKPTELRRKIGYLFQTPYLFEKTVRDNFLYIDDTISDDAITELLQNVQLASSKIDAGVETLSVGEKQRVALARLLATNPEIILLDEPTSALDPSITESIERLIVSIVKKESLTAIIVTHNPEQALRIGQEGLLLVDGRLIESGTVEELINNPSSAEGKRYKARELQ